MKPLLDQWILSCSRSSFSIWGVCMRELVLVMSEPDRPPGRHRCSAIQRQPVPHRTLLYALGWKRKSPRVSDAKTAETTLVDRHAFISSATVRRHSEIGIRPDLHLCYGVDSTFVPYQPTRSMASLVFRRPRLSHPFSWRRLSRLSLHLQV